jgi:acetyltransferase-like isoleucine patch superfamily enzyme
LKILQYGAGLTRLYRTPLVSIFALVDGRSTISRKAKVNRFARVRNSTIGNYSYIGPSSRIENVDIGKFCSISWNCCIGLESHDLSQLSTSPIFTEKYNGTGSTWLREEPMQVQASRSLIGNDVWIGVNAVVLSGLKIGDGAVIGAGAVVTKDVPPYAIVGGVPAKVIGARFSEETIQKLLEKRWWDASEDEIKRNLSIFQKRDIKLADIANLPQATD